MAAFQTFFITPDGLDAADEETGRVHSTTAEELALILRYCLCLSSGKRGVFNDYPGTVMDVF